MDNKVVQLSGRKPQVRPQMDYEEEFGIDRVFGASVAGIAALFVVALVLWLIRHYSA